MADFSEHGVDITSLKFIFNWNIEREGGKADLVSHRIRSFRDQRSGFPLLEMLQGTSVNVRANMKQ